METIALSLVSHTNVGKTTLARTLMRRDVGTVFDQAHVTEVNEAWPLLEVDGARLVLWDTPGFGDTARLLKRMRRDGDPVGWFLHQVWDRINDRALWCNQEALRNIREDADVVLYLVSAAEDPQDAGYVRLELDLLGWLGRPVLLLLNQTGSAGDARELEQVWQRFAQPWEHVRDVLSLDAFTRCWVQEGVLLERVEQLLPEGRQAAMARMRSAWHERNLAVFRKSTAALADVLAETAADRERLGSVNASRTEKRRAMSVLATRLEQRVAALMDRLIELHGLDGQLASEVRERLEDFHVQGESPLSVKGSALWGGLLTGAATGVAADLVTGGLTFGSGAVVGAVLGALGGAGLARGYEFVLARGEPGVSWGVPFLDELLRRVLLNYLAVAQFGRGRGTFQDDVLVRGAQADNPWLLLVQYAVGRQTERIAAAWALGRGSAGRNPQGSVDMSRRLERLLAEVLRDVLAARYPRAAHVLA